MEVSVAQMVCTLDMAGRTHEGVDAKTHSQCRDDLGKEVNPSAH